MNAAEPMCTLNMVGQAPRAERAALAIAHNRRAHNRIGGAYDGNHPEIFNDVEQARLAQAVARTVAAAAQGRGGEMLRALDVGCGTGNLSRHLLDAGVRVTGADLSSALLAESSRRFAATGRFETMLLNGRDLRPLADGSFDIVAAYSVLHHIPDYAALVREMARVTRPGGVVFIDHERSDESWTAESYREFLGEAVVWPPRRWWYWLQPSRYWNRLRPMVEWRRWFDRRWMPEGDLHIWPDDHVEWTQVEAALAAGGCSREFSEQYLLFEPRYQRAVWELWRTRTADMRLLVARRSA